MILYGGLKKKVFVGLSGFVRLFWCCSTAFGGFGWFC